MVTNPFCLPTELTWPVPIVHFDLQSTAEVTLCPFSLETTAPELPGIQRGVARPIVDPGEWKVSRGGQRWLGHQPWRCCESHSFYFLYNMMLWQSRAFQIWGEATPLKACSSQQLWPTCLVHPVTCGSPGLAWCLNFSSLCQASGSLFSINPGLPDSQRCPCSCSTLGLLILLSPELFTPPHLALPVRTTVEPLALDPNTGPP